MHLQAMVFLLSLNHGWKYAACDGGLLRAICRFDTLQLFGGGGGKDVRDTVFAALLPIDILGLKHWVPDAVVPVSRDTQEELEHQMNLCHVTCKAHVKYPWGF
jgi:hypothetical protein